MTNFIIVFIIAGIILGIFSIAIGKSWKTALFYLAIYWSGVIVGVNKDKIDHFPLHGPVTSHRIDNVNICEIYNHAVTYSWENPKTHEYIKTKIRNSDEFKDVRIFRDLSDGRKPYITYKQHFELHIRRTIFDLQVHIEQGNSHSCQTDQD